MTQAEQEAAAVPRYPEARIFFNARGPSGNSFAVIGRAVLALRRVGASGPELEEFKRDAMAGDYDNMLAVVRAWVAVEAEDRD